MFSLMLSAALGLPHQRASFPDIRPLHAVRKIDLNRPSLLELTVYSKSRRPAYKIQCASASFSSKDFDYSGDFECRLIEVPHSSRYSTLLTENLDQSRDWESRGRFFAASLKPPCSGVADFGAVRTFSLRKMRVSLSVRDPRFRRDGTLYALTAQIDVVPDGLAHTSIAKRVQKPSGVPKTCKLDELF